MRSLYAKTLTVLLAASIWLPQPGFCARFADTSTSWTEKYINKLSDKGVIPPSPDGKFNPDKPVTRAQLADWLVKVLGLDSPRQSLEIHLRVGHVPERQGLKSLCENLI